MCESLKSVVVNPPLPLNCKSSVYRKFTQSYKCPEILVNFFVKFYALSLTYTNTDGFSTFFFILT